MKTKHNSEKCRTCTGLVTIASSSRDLDSKISALEKASQRYPRQPANWISLASLQSETGNLSIAEQTLSKALEMNPDCDDAWYHLAIVRLRMGQTQKAISAFFKTIELNRKHVCAWHKLAETMESLDMIVQAIQGYERVLELSPGCPRARESLAACLLLSGEPGPAEKLLLENVRQGSAPARSHYLLGQIYKMTDRVSDAVLCLETFCRLAESSGDSTDRETLEAGRKDAAELRKVQAGA